MKLKNGFIVHNAGSETLLVPTGQAEFSGVVNGNTTFGYIMECLKNDITEQQIISDMKKKFDAEEGAIERDVKKAISELRKIGAIDE